MSRGRILSRNKHWSLYGICLLFVALWCISPPLFINGAARVIALVSMIIALRLGRIYHRRYFAMLVFYVTYTLGIGFFKQGIEYFLLNIQAYIIFAFAYIAVNKDEKSDGTIYNFDKIIKVVEWIYPIWMIITLRAYNSIPNISRLLANNNNENVVVWSQQGIGGYGMIYSLVFYNIILLYILLNKGKKRILTAVNYILSLVTIIMAGYSIALIAVLLGSIIVLFIREKRVERIILVIFVAGILYALFLMFQTEIFNGLLSLADGTMYEQKIKDIINSFTEASAQGTLESRTILYQYSWETFLKNPFVGSAFSEKLMFGGHSFFLDTFAKFGLIGGIPFLYLLLYYPIRCIRKNKEFSLSLAILVLMIFVGGLNNLSAAFAPMVYVVYPALVKDD